MGRAVTRAEEVYARLRADILAGRRQPGARLPFTDLVASYGASMGVLREALARLGAEGLVTTEPQHGYRVIELSAEELDHLTVARCEIEALVLRSAVKNGDLGWESRVVAALHRLERTEIRDLNDPNMLSDDWAEAHTDFHRALIEGCPNPWLRSMTEGLWDAIEIYIRWSAPVQPPERDIGAEHRDLAEAALARDADTLCERLSRHVTYTQQIVLNGFHHLLSTGTASAPGAISDAERADPA